MRVVLYQSKINVEQNYALNLFYFFFSLGLILIRKKLGIFIYFSPFFGNDNENKKSGRIDLLDIIQTIFDQNMGSIYWKMKALRTILEIFKNTKN